MILSTNKRILKNTFFLFIRMFFVLAVGLVTVRLVLNILGAKDYGIYTVVAGIVSFFAFFSSTMINSCQRFFTIEIGRGNLEKLSKYFSVTLVLFTIIGVAVFILAQTLGLWFVQNKLIFDIERSDAVWWLYQFTIISFLFNILSIPFTSLILSYEKMDAYAYISIIEVVFKIITIICLYYLIADKLILYAALVAATNILITLVYIIYCFLNFKEIKVKFKIYGSEMNEVFVFSGWNIFGSLASVFKNEGNNILLNLFFGPILNASRGIAFQVNGVINMFVFNFTQAVKLQIIKYYADSDINNMNNLVCKSSKYQVFIVLLISMPLLIETPYVMNIWLSNYPEYTIVFCRLAILLSIIDALSYSIMSAILATGEIKFYQIFVGGLIMFNIPVAYLFLSLGFEPEITLMISITISIIAFFLRLYFYKKSFGFKIISMSKKIIQPVFFVFLCSLIFPLLLVLIYNESFSRFLLTCITSVLTSVGAIYFLGLKKDEKKVLRKIVLSTYLKLLK